MWKEFSGYCPDKIRWKKQRAPNNPTVPISIHIVALKYQIVLLLFFFALFQIHHCLSVGLVWFVSFVGFTIYADVCDEFQVVHRRNSIILVQSLVQNQLYTDSTVLTTLVRCSTAYWMSSLLLASIALIAVGLSLCCCCCCCSSWEHFSQRRFRVQFNWIKSLRLTW